MPHADKTAEITFEPDTYQIAVDDGIALTARRATSREILRQKPSNYTSDHANQSR